MSKRVGNSGHILAHVLVLLPGSIVKSGHHSSAFLRVSRMWFLLVRLACMAIYTGLWHRLSNSPPWACLSLFPLREVANRSKDWVPFQCAEETFVIV